VSQRTKKEPAVEKITKKVNGVIEAFGFRFLLFFVAV